MAVLQEDYEAAKRIKDQIEGLSNEVLGQPMLEPMNPPRQEPQRNDPTFN